MTTPLSDTLVVEDVWRPLSDAETDRAERLIALLSKTLRSQLVNLDARMASGAIDPDTVALAVALKVKTLMASPTDGASSVTQSLGTGSLTRSYTKSTNNLRAYRFTGSEIADILGITTIPGMPRTVRTAPVAPPGWAP